MPLFDFKCNKCGEEFEKLVKTSEIPVCITCESEDISRLVSCTRDSGIVLNGEGFYKPSKSSW